MGFLERAVTILNRSEVNYESEKTNDDTVWYSLADAAKNRVSHSLCH